MLRRRGFHRVTTVAVFGGSFNPPHIAHVLAASFILSMEAMVDELCIIPCFRHPFAKSLAPFDDRFAMCELAFSWLPRVTVSAVERDLGGESRTIRTIRHLQGLYPTWTMRLVIGSDVVADTPRWDSFEEIRRIASPIVLSRKGFGGDSDGLFPHVSSTQVRDAMRRGDLEIVRSWVPHRVVRYMVERSLYGDVGGA